MFQIRHTHAQGEREGEREREREREGETEREREREREDREDREYAHACARERNARQYTRDVHRPYDCDTRAFKNVDDTSLLYDGQMVPLTFVPLRRHILNSAYKTRPQHFFGDVLPAVVVREQDLDYQRHRIMLFRKLLTDYPASQRFIMQEAKIDIPPLLRCELWAVILGVGPDAQQIYDSIDKESEGPSDHQIDLDIPRCHQYNPLLSSPEGHRKMRRILKAWVAHNTDMLYWQGLDSLLAPFLTLSFNDEARAFCCLQETVSKYLSNFFKRGNGMYLQAYLLVFRQLVAYHEPELAWHLFKIGFHPELFAISWFLTLFTRMMCRASGRASETETETEREMY
jgi:hypothetical protein